MSRMQYRYTKHQVARGAFPDAKIGNRVYLFKRVQTLRATYQIRLLAHLVAEKGQKLVINVPMTFVPHPTLLRLMREMPKTIYIEKTK